MKNYFPLFRYMPVLCLAYGAISDVKAQAPQQLNYQAVVRNTQGQTQPANTPVLLKFTIHNDSATGPGIYSEIISTTTNAFGLVNVQIGTNASLATVDWSNGAKFLQVEANINNAGYND